MSRFVLTAQLQLQAPTNTAQVVRQIQSQLNNVQVNVQVQGTAQATRQVQQVAQSLNAANSAASNLGRTFAISVKRFTALAVATRAVSLFTNTLANAVNEAIDFERQLIKVSQVTGQTIGELRFLTKSITDLSTGLGVSSKDLLNTSQLLLQAGISARDTEVALKTLAKAALAPNFDSLSETTEGAIAILAQFQQGVGSLEGQLSSINAVAGAFAVEAGDLIDVIRRTGGVFKASGGSLNELIALFTSVRATTRESAESIGTGLRTIFTRIQRPKTIEFLKQFGVELVDLEGKFVGPFEAVRRLSEALTGLGERDITFIRIAEELGGFRQIGKVLPLLQQFKTSQDALNVAQKAGNGLTKDAETAQQALAVRITKVQEEFLALIRSISETSSFQFFANTTLNLASALIKLADALKPIIPLLTAVATIKLAQGLSSFVGGFGRGIGSGRTFNKGGKVLGFARGGMVPGSGNRDTVPAMLQPGEFVIRKSSVNKLGAGNLAAMNQNRYASGGLIDRIASGKKTVGAALLENRGLTPGNFSISKEEIQKRSNLKLNDKFPKLGQFSAPREGLTQTTYKSFSKSLDDAIILAANSAASNVANDLGLAVKQIDSNTKNEFLSSINTGTRGNLFEDVLSVLKGGPFAQEPGRPFDFPSGLSGVLKDDYLNLPDAFIDAKASLDAASLSGKGSLYEKTIRQIVNELKFPENMQKYTTSIPIKGKEEFAREKKYLLSQLGMTRLDAEKAGFKKVSSNFYQLKNNGGLIQKFAAGGRAKGILPRPSAINDLIKSGGGYVDIDRTLLRTVGDIAYGKARTEQEKQAVLQKYFLDPVARLKDIKSVGLTQFGKQLQASIKSGQIQGSRLRVLSKSTEVPGVRSYLSGLFGIPPGNMRFTAGGSKVPFMRNRGPLVDDIPSNARFASGGSVGTDTVPALLTPGEFVVNKKSAQSIGYGALGRMNKVGKYAKGGIVQHFASGDRVLPAQRTVSKEQRKFLIEQYKASQSTGAMSSGGLMSQIQQERTRIEQEHIEKIKAVYKRSYLDIRKIHDEQVKDAQASGKSIDEIKEIFKKSNNAIKSLKTDTLAQVKAVQTSTSIQSTAKQNAIQQNPFRQAMLAASSGTFNRTDFGPSYDKLTQAQLKQVLSTQKATIASQKAAAADTQESSASSRAAQADEREAASSNKTSSMFGGVGTGLTFVTASLQSLLPPIDENSSSLLKMSHSLLTLATMTGSVIFALEAFGISLNKQNIASGLSTITSIFTGGLGKIARGAGASVGSSVLGMGVGNAAATAAAGLTSALTAVAAPALAAAATFYIIKSSGDVLVEAFGDYENRIKKAKESGDIEKTRELAIEQQSAKRNVNVAAGATSGAVAGAIIGSAIPIVGTAVGAVVGAGIGTTIAAAFSDLPAYAGDLAASQAAQSASTKALTKATEGASKALQDFQNGNISAIDVLKSTSTATLAAQKQRLESENLAITAEKNKSNVGLNTFGGAAAGALAGAAIGSIVPIVGTAIGAAVGAGIGGFAANTASNKRNNRINQEISATSKEAKKAEEDALKAATPGLQVLQRQVAATGGSFEDFLNIVKATDPDLFDIIMRQGSKDLSDSFTNLAKEAERTRKAFDAMNLGFQKISAVSGALSVGLENYLSSQEAGYSALDNTIRTLEASVTNAAQGISDADFSASLGSASDGLRKLGASEKQITKFEQNLSAINTAQKFYAQASEEVKNKLIADFKAGRGADLSAVGKREKFAEALTDQLVGVDENTKKRISEAIAGAEIDPKDLEQIAMGNLSVLDKVLKDLGETTLNQVIGPLKELAKYEQALANLTKKRIELENNLINAQRGVLQANLEAQEIIAKYGGPALTSQIRTQNAIAQANIQAQGTGVGALRTGSAAELRARSAQTRVGLANIGNIRTQAAAGNTAAQQQLAGQSGVALEAQEKRLLELAKSDYDTTKLLIQNKEEELKLIKEKNALEKSSIDALIGGDIDKFFEQQAAVGAQAAIALGSERLQGAFGADALGAAAQDIRRQQEAGQQTLFGQQLGGAGGLTERAFGAAIGARGITDPRLSQIAAGTTAAESNIESQIRELAATLPNYAQVQLQSSQQELVAAQRQFQAAEMQLQAARANVEARSGGVGIPTMAKGGTVYANRGIFVPRGTDTVPAMLTPGEFVVRREAVQRGNNLQMLQAMNRGSSAGQSSVGGAIGMANGGVVNQTQYLMFGGFAKAINGLLDGDFINKLSQTFNSFMSDMSKNIDKLNSTNLDIKLDTTNINVNLNGGTFLGQMTEQVRSAVMQEVAKEIQNYSAGEGGRLRKNSGIVSRE
jgi:TP901 family phage tail tape measure protein